MQRILVALCVTAAIGTTFAQVPTADLAKPPADARHLIIHSTGGKHGDSWMWVAADGTRMGRESWNLRGQVFELDSSGTTGRDGMPAKLTIRGVTPSGDAAETFSISGGTANWKSQVDAGSAAYSNRAFYLSQGGPIDTAAWFLEALIAAPDRSLDLLPSGKAHATKMIDLEVGTGTSRQTVALWSITGLSNSPTPMWSDAKNKFFAVTNGLAWLPEAYVDEQAKMEAAQQKALAALAP